jgi:hypothetical protein
MGHQETAATAPGAEEMNRAEKPPTIELFEQLPEPAWATELADGKPEKASALVAQLAGWETHVGGRDIGFREEMRAIAGRALLRKAERDNPHWDGKTRILAPGDVLRRKQP